MLTAEEQKLSEELRHTQSARRRKAAKTIGKLKLTNLSAPIFEAFLKEREDSRTWETQACMISSLGRIQCKDALPVIHEIIVKNLEFDAITSSASEASVRIESIHTPPAKIALELFKNGKHSVQYGALSALYFDKVLPSESDMEKIIDAVEATPRIEPPGMVGDLRELLICLMAYWPANFTKPYLEKYSSDANIRKIVVEYALKGKAYGPKEY
ncbi:MAG: hypothetical protein IPK50_15005 [Fibrobacterota bacterium]|nr:hypothetical protein [Fibrobacterota bacterium]QQS03601.1 MAG: hypothetical protein IPK50_15005 [Fibrobacterota bacterium]